MDGVKSPTPTLKRGKRSLFLSPSGLRGGNNTQNNRNAKKMKGLDLLKNSSQTSLSTVSSTSSHSRLNLSLSQGLEIQESSNIVKRDDNNNNNSITSDTSDHPIIISNDTTTTISTKDKSENNNKCHKISLLDSNILTTANHNDKNFVVIEFVDLCKMRRGVKFDKRLSVIKAIKEVIMTAASINNIHTNNHHNSDNNKNPGCLHNTSSSCTDNNSIKNDFNTDYSHEDEANHDDNDIAYLLRCNGKVLRMEKDMTVGQLDHKQTYYIVANQPDMTRRHESGSE